MKYEFTPVCETGIKLIDDEHKVFFQYINSALEALERTDDEAVATAKNLMKKLREYADTHFAHEEKYMRDNHDAELVRQIHEHEKFRRDIDKMAGDGELSKEKLSEMVTFLAKWLYRHILTSDTLIGKDTGHHKFNLTKEFITGIEIVDTEHQGLFDIINRTWGVLEDDMAFDKYDKILGLLNELKVYTQRHFAHEEEYMESIQYEGLDMQVKLHTAFIERVVNINLDDHDDMDENQDEYLAELLEFLNDWLINHILRFDTKIPVK